MAQTLKRRKLEEAFPALYVQNGMNATRAYMVMRPNCQPNTAATEAGELLKKPEIVRAIEDLLPKENEAEHVIARALRAPLAKKRIEWRDLKAFTELDLKMRGKLGDNGAKTALNIAIISKS